MARVAAGLGGRVTLGEAFDPKRNSIGVLRWLAAFAVLFSHAYELGGFGRDPLFELTGVTMGTSAVVFFFALSGFLVTSSIMRAPTVVQYAKARILRIMPAFWVCLVVTATVFASLAWIHERGSMRGILSADPSALRYVVVNSALKIQQWGIGGLLGDLPLPGVFNGSLWTLYHEAVCYVLLIPLLWAGALHRRTWLLAATTGALFAANVAVELGPTSSRLISMLNTNGMYLSFTFLLGACAWVWRDRLPVGPPLLAFAAGSWLAGIALELERTLVPLGIAALTLHLLSRKRLAWFGRRYDVSYGLYIYAFPVQQLLALWGVPRWGLAPYVVLTVLITQVLALASYVAVERPALRFK